MWMLISRCINVSMRESIKLSGGVVGQVILLLQYILVAIKANSYKLATCVLIIKLIGIRLAVK